MGLDMYLSKGKRVAGFKVDDYKTVSNVLQDYKSKEDFQKEFTSLREALPDLNGVEELDDAIVECGEYFHWIDIHKQVGYWRKANQIHSWFVHNCQDGVDECQLTEVPKEKIEELLVICLDVIKHKNVAKQELPTQSGFFFGRTDYDDYYFEDIQDTIKILQAILKDTDFEKEIVFYQSSW